FQFAEHEDRPVLVRQATHFPVEDRLHIVPESLRERGGFRHFHHLLLPGLSLRPRRSGLARRLMSHAVEPVADHFPWHYGRSFAEKDEERRLESVFGVVVPAEHSLADAPNHDGVPPNERFESRLLTA